MANIIVVKGNYQNESAIYNEINYVFSSEYLQYSGAAGVLWYPSLRNCYTDIVLEKDEADPNMIFIANAFKAVKAAYNKTNGEQIAHIVVGFKERDIINSTLAYLFADQFANYIGQRFQVVYGVHQGSYLSQHYLHIHFVINTVSYVDGNRLYDKRSYYYELLDAAKTMIPNIKWDVFKK